MALYKKFRGVMYENDCTQQDIAKMIGRSPSYIAERMRGKKPFDMEDVYKLCDCFELSYTDIPIYFPPKGRMLSAKAGST